MSYFSFSNFQTDDPTPEDCKALGRKYGSGENGTFCGLCGLDECPLGVKNV